MRLTDGYARYFKEKYGQVIDPETHVLLLLKAIYGLIQAARQWWKKFKEAMAHCGYYPTAIDPCLFIKKDKNDIMLVQVYVNDIIFGSTKPERCAKNLRSL